MTVLFFEKKSKQKKLQLSGIITAPLCKGSCRRKPTEGLFFFTTLPPLRGPPPLTQGRLNPSRRRLQACSAYLQIPCVKGAPPQAVRDCSPLLTHRSRGFPLSHKRGLIKINPRSDSFLFDLLSYLLSQKTRLGCGFFHQSINPNGKSSEREETL